MKKTFFCLVFIVLLSLVLTSCGCEHQYVESITKEATCSATGIKTHTCTLCNDSYTEEIPMVEHTLNDSTITKAPTCVDEGEMVASCTVCGATGVTQKIDKVAHKYTETVTQQPTCTATGTKTKTCSVCGEITTETMAQISHAYKTTVVKKVTCTEDGKVIHTCTLCQNTNEEIKKATGHNWQNATCETAKSCSNCKLTDGVPLGHIWKDATCDAAKTCNRCNKTEGSPLGHSWDKGVITKEATMYANGEVVYTCSTCLTKRTEIIPSKKPTVNLPATPFIITDSDGNQAKITSVSYTVKFGNMFYVDYAYECITGEDTCFKIKLYDEDGYLVKNSTYWFRGEQGTKGKDQLFLIGEIGIYSLEFVGH